MFLFFLPCSCVFCRASVRPAGLLCVLWVRPLSSCSSVLCRAPVCPAVLLCVLPCPSVFFGFCRAPVFSAVSAN
eukprot:2054500-Pyramimonas_sp.AAC.1